MTDLRAIEFPPLLTGIAVAGDPLTAALESVETEVEPGSVFYAVDEDVCHTALVLAPEVPLSEAMSVSFAVTLGMNDALGALAPPEVAVHLVRPDRIKVNGALCGELRATASSNVPTEEPDWLILELRLPVTSVNSAPGTTPDATTLHDEGCGDILGSLKCDCGALACLSRKPHALHRHPQGGTREPARLPRQTPEPAL